MEIVDHTAASLSKLIREKRLSPVEVTEAFLARIAKWDGKLHAFTEVYEAEARQAAEAADKAIRAGAAVGPMHGMPIALKDLTEIDGKAVSAGCSAWTRRSDHSAAVVHGLTSQGFIIIGKTHLVQFGISGWGTNPDMGSPWNPWNLDLALTPGGSSSGSAVAVAGGLVPWALGTDTGGSIRIPSAWCGLTGMKASEGLIDKTGVVSLSKTLDTIGPMARDAADAELLLAAMAGHPLENGVREGVPDISRLRLACLSRAECQHAAADVLAAYDASLDLLASLGARIVELKLPWRLADLAQISGAIVYSEAYAQFGALVKDNAFPLDPYSRDAVLRGREISPEAYSEALERRRALQKEFYACLAEFDALLMPTTQTVALEIEGLDQQRTPSHFTRFANVLNLCAIAIPNGLTTEHLPISLQIAGLPGMDASILGIARAYQAETEWHCHRPKNMGLLACC